MWRLIVYSTHCPYIIPEGQESVKGKGDKYHHSNQYPQRMERIVQEV